jgi:CheY-like chemotaxis protein/HPt (histidine-containing phosphotransfer) domain-containing protein
VEDNATNCRIIAQRTTQWGMVCKTVANGHDALGIIEKDGPFDAALLDLQLPEMDGLALADEIRKLPSGQHLPLLLMSAMRVRGDDPRPARAGISIFVYKPIRPAQVLESLCRGMNIQLQREKKAPLVPALDANLAKRLPLRLLLADDNAINLKVGLSVLQKLGYRADVASNGREVLKALEAKPYDILFLDVQMPEMDGLEATRQIRERWPESRRPRIVAMTGHALMGDREKCLAAGMDDFISKPVRIGELQAALERWGQTKSQKPDTAFVRRERPSRVADLLDHAVLAELRQMPASDGVPIVKELINLFLGSAPQRIAQINQFLEDPQKMAFHAHALKSMSLNLGAKKMVELCQKLEALGHGGNVEGAPGLLQELERTYNLTASELIPLRDQAG